MLNKAICRHCCNTEPTDDEDPEIVPWDREDEDNWQQGFIICNHADRDVDQIFPINVAKDPPKDCLFLMEHLILNQTKGNCQ